VTVEFERKLKKLGITGESAKDMAELDIKWDFVTAMSEIDLQIFCHEQNCSFQTSMRNPDLTEHCKTVHKWGIFKCTQYENCKYEANSEEIYNITYVT